MKIGTSLISRSSEIKEEALLLIYILLSRKSPFFSSIALCNKILRRYIAQWGIILAHMEEQIRYGDKNWRKRSSQPYKPPSEEELKMDVDDVWRSKPKPQPPRAKLIWQVRAENKSKQKS